LRQALETSQDGRGTSIGRRKWDTLTIDLQSRGYEIPANFAGVSIFTRTQERDHKGVPGNLFSGTNNVTLGGSTIANNAAWAGKWTTLGTSKEGCSLTVPAASAAIVRLWR
jgi:hypothetical protein